MFLFSFTWALAKSFLEKIIISRITRHSGSHRIEISKILCWRKEGRTERRIQLNFCSWSRAWEIWKRKWDEGGGGGGEGLVGRGSVSSRRQIGKGRGLKFDMFICIGPMSAMFQVLTGVSNDCFTPQAKLFFVEKKTLKFSDAKISWKQEWEKFSLS